MMRFLEETKMYDKYDWNHFQTPEKEKTQANRINICPNNPKLCAFNTDHECASFKFCEKQIFIGEEE